MKFKIITQDWSNIFKGENKKSRQLPAPTF